MKPEESGMRLHRPEGKRRAVALVSPFAIILRGFLCALFFSRFMGGWAFSVVMPVYWVVMFAVVYRTLGRAEIARLFQKPSGNPVWAVLSFVVGLSPVAMSIQYLRDVLAAPRAPLLFVLCIVVAVVNPFFEELYWRGLVLENSFASKAGAILFSTLLFALSHPFMWGGCFPYRTEIGFPLDRSSLWGCCGAS